MTLTAGLAIGLCATTGLSLALGIGAFRRRREIASINADLASLLAHDGDLGRTLGALQGEVIELRAALVDAQRRWGFDLSRWPHVQALVGHPSPAEVSWWLLDNAPGIRTLRSSGRATESFFRPSEGWRPPRALVEGNGRS